jgi:exopolysaccharide biosynthesis polyprenyl glycosylphosphotransferase
MLAIADAGAATLISITFAWESGLILWPLALLPAWVGSAKLLGLYDQDHRSIRHLTVDELQMIVIWAGVAAAGLALVMPLTPIGDVPSSTMLLAWLIGAASAFVLRATARGLWRRLTPPETTAVIGSGKLAASIRRKIELFPDTHLTLDEDSCRDSMSAAGEYLDEDPPVDRMIVASDEIDPEAIETLAVACREHQVKLSVVSPLQGRAAAVARLSELADLPILEYNTWDVSRSTMSIKRGFDLAFGGLGCLLLAPFVPLVALAIKLDSRGPVFYVQVRAGLNGRPFRMLKFRTMSVDAEKHLQRLLTFEDLADPVFKFESDPRVTRVGRLLRRFSIDELPQFANVLLGDMSVVGPRPEQVELVELYRPEHRFRLAVKPGLTGPMQVSGRGALSFAERLAVELDYVENVSLGRDLRILAQTLPTISRGTGAY